MWWSAPSLPRKNKETFWNALVGYRILKFVKDRRSYILGVWAAPVAPETLAKGGGAKPPTFWKSLRGPFCFGGPQTSNDLSGLLRCLWADFRKWCRDQGRESVKGRLSLQTLGRKDSRNVYPELPSQIKGAGVQTFCLYVAHLAAEFVGDSEHSQLRATCAWGFSEYLAVLQTAPLVMSELETARLLHGGRTYIDCYSALAASCAESGVFLFKCRPKFHYYDHTLDFARDSRLNPQKLGCWHEESYLGKLKRIAQKCHGATVLTTSFQRYFIYLSLRWQRRRTTGLRVLPP